MIAGPGFGASFDGMVGIVGSLLNEGAAAAVFVGGATGAGLGASADGIVGIVGSLLNEGTEAVVFVGGAAGTACGPVGRRTADFVIGRLDDGIATVVFSAVRGATAGGADFGTVIGGIAEVAFTEFACGTLETGGIELALGLHSGIGCSGGAVAELPFTIPKSEDALLSGTRGKLLLLFGDGEIGSPNHLSG